MRGREGGKDVLMNSRSGTIIIFIYYNYNIIYVYNYYTLDLKTDDKLYTCSKCLLCI